MLTNDQGCDRPVAHSGEIAEQPSGRGLAIDPHDSSLTDERGGAGPDVLPMLDVYMPMMHTAALVAAGRLDLFERLGAESMSIGDLARVMGVAEHGLRPVIDLLTMAGYLVLEGNVVANSPLAAAWFAPGGRVNYSAGLRWTAHAWQLMDGLSDAVRVGGPDRFLWDRMRATPALGPAFADYMRSFAQDLAGDLGKNVVLSPDAKRLLDLGGSHGLHSIAYCERHPELEAVIVDLESALAFTEDLILERGLAERITLRPGDMTESPWGEDYDVVFYLSVAHNQTKSDNRMIMQRIAQALKPGGMLVIHEYLDDQPALAFHAAFKMTLLVETGTRLYSSAEVTTWLIEAGFSPPERIDLEPREKGSLLIVRCGRAPISDDAPPNISDRQ